MYCIDIIKIKLTSLLKNAIGFEYRDKEYYQNLYKKMKRYFNIRGFANLKVNGKYIFSNFLRRHSFFNRRL